MGMRMGLEIAFFTCYCLLLITSTYLLWMGCARLCFWFSLFAATVVLWRLDVVLGIELQAPQLKCGWFPSEVKL